MSVPTHSNFRPPKPLLVWDGQCGFCRYWITRWKGITGNAVSYAPYQEIVGDIPDIPERAFKEAVRLIAPDGKIHSGAEAVYRTLHYGDSWGFLYPYYRKSALFRALSDRAYVFVAHNRPFLFKVSKIMFGKDPRHFFHYWIFYLVLIVLIIIGFTGPVQK